MNLPPDILTQRGSDVLTSMSRFCEEFADYYRGQSGAWNDGFRALADVMLVLKHRQEEHIARMEQKRAKGERVWSETDQTVDAAIGAIRSAFIQSMAAKNRKPAA